MPTLHRWRPIDDLGADPASLTDGELTSLSRVWRRQQGVLAEIGGLAEFEKRLRREWAIETGVIERVYTLDRGVTRTLIEKGIHASLIPRGGSDRDNVEVARIIQDHYDTLEGMFDLVGGQRELSTSYVKELHAALLRNQDTYAVVDQFGQVFERAIEKGKYKSAPNSPVRPNGTVHEYCPPEHVDAEMDRLIQMSAGHRTKRTPVEVDAAWLHHCFTQIHPFADGNGRVARALSSLVFIKDGWFPLIVQREDWAAYIDALEKADAGDLRPLVALFVESQRSALLQAIETAHDVLPIETADQAIAAARDRLLLRGKLGLREWEAARETAQQLLQSAEARLEEIAGRLRSEIARTNRDYEFRVEARPGNGIDYGSVEAVEKAGQAADFGAYHALVLLWLKAGRHDILAISFHAVGPRFRGMIAALPYLATGDGEIHLLQRRPFYINYEEETVSAQTRFAAWVEPVIVDGLNEWRQSL